MHILLTNDDGPLDDKACPYIKYLVDEINETTDWQLSIVVPNQQRSWIGKAHFAGRALKPTYIYTETSTDSPNDDINRFDGPYDMPQHKKNHQEWVLIDSTPAACADIGIHHLLDQPIDLVVSGPNFGKNSSNLYILSSGTVGAALEACTHGHRAIALSYEFRSLDHDFHQLKQAAKISVKLIRQLYENWHAGVNLYSVNVPLVELLNLHRTQVKYAPLLDNKWLSIYKPAIDKDGKKVFEWSPDFKAVYKDGLTRTEHSDNRVLLENNVSVTPLRLTFHHVGPSEGTILLIRRVLLITIDSSNYLYEPYVRAFEKLGFSVTSDRSILQRLDDSLIFHYGEYEDIDLDLLQLHPHQYFVPTYIYRKALIRKHFLANTVHHYVAKNPSSVLKASVPESYQLEVDYAEFLDDALDDAYELREEIDAGSKTWILKPSMSDKGQGIRLFNTIEQLQAIFNLFDENEEEEETGVIVSQLRHFVVQEYQTNPLLLEHYNHTKFHLRVYVVCVGNLKVYVYKHILALFAEAPWAKPSITDDAIPLDGHLTNTCLQGDNATVVPFWDLEGLSAHQKNRVFSHVLSVTGELFTAAASVDKINFQPLANAVEIFGVDYLVANNLAVKLLEVNSYPDFKQTGNDLKALIYTLVELVAADAVAPLMGLGTNEGGSKNSALVSVL